MTLIDRISGKKYCPSCNKLDTVVFNGKRKNGIKKFYCTGCEKYFNEKIDPYHKYKMDKYTHFRQSVLNEGLSGIKQQFLTEDKRRLCYKKLNVSKLSREIGVSRPTIYKWVERYNKALDDLDALKKLRGE